MTPVSNTTAAAPIAPPPTGATGVPASGATSNGPAVPPCSKGSTPTDALGLMMATVERMSSESMEATENEIRTSQKKLDKALDEYLDKIAEAIAAAKRAAEQARKKKKKSGWGKFTGSVGLRLRQICRGHHGLHEGFDRGTLRSGIQSRHEHQESRSSAVCGY